MSHGFSSRQRPALGRAGTSTLEFALVAIPFLFMMIAGMDLGRYFVSAQLTAHSMLRRDGTGMVSTIKEVDTIDERSLKPFET